VAQACSTIDSLSIQGSTPETAGVTAFANEACEAVGALMSHRKPSPITASPETIANITEYFSRPVPVANFSTSTTQVVLSTLAGSLNNILSYFPSSASRLLGVFSMRFTTVFTLTASATPFHQGVLALSASYTSNDAATWTRNDRYFACTNVAHVRLDLSESTMVQLRIPYVAEVETKGIVAGTPDTIPWFNVSVVQLLPTPLPASLVTAKCQLFMHLEDLELFGASPQVLSTVTPFSGGKTKIVRRDTMKPQAGKMSAEIEEASFPYSSTVKSAAKTLSLASRAIPLLSPILSTPTWFLNAAANSLRSFGFSKPVVRDPIVRIVKGSTVGEHHIDLPTPSLKLAPTSDNIIATDSTLGTTDVDEMALEYVLSHWGQVMHGTLSTLQSPGQVFYLNALCPLAQWFKTSLGSLSAATVSSNYQLPQYSVLGSNAFMPTTLMAVSQIFRFYRGGFQFRITFAKTKFHGGRVMLTFNPSYTSASFQAPTSGGQAQPMGQSTIFDLRDSNIIEFECPYVTTRPLSALSDPFGTFTMTLVNPLIATQSVSTTIDYMVEVRASPGFTLACPAGFMWPSGSRNAIVGQVNGVPLVDFPSSLAGPAILPQALEMPFESTPSFSRSVSQDFEPPARVSTMEVQSGSSVAIPRTVPSMFGPDVTKYTSGEKINSLKQLIMMPKITNADVVPANGGDYVAVPPWWYTNLSTIRSANPSPNTFDAESFGTAGNIAQWYAFVNGGTEGHVYTPGRPTNTCMVYWSGQPYNRLITTNTFQNTPASNVPRIIAVDDQPLHFVTPAYQRGFRIRPSVVSAVAWVPRFGGSARAPTLIPGPNMPYVTPKVRAFNNTIDVLPMFLSRAAADDARCAVWQGPLPFLLPGAVVNGVYDPDSVSLD